jgi:hypothetical protein
LEFEKCLLEFISIAQRLVITGAEKVIECSRNAFKGFVGEVIGVVMGFWEQWNRKPA